MNPVNSSASSVPSNAAIHSVVTAETASAAAAASAGNAASHSSSEPPRETSSTSSSNVLQTFFQDRYKENFVKSGTLARAHKRLKNACPELGELDGKTPLGTMLSNASARNLKPADLKEGDILVSYVPESMELNAFRVRTVDKQSQDHNGILESINQGDARDVHVSMYTHTAGNPLATKQWTELEGTWQALESVQLMDASRAFEAMKDPLMSADSESVSRNGTHVLNQMNGLQGALAELGEIENVLVKLDALEQALGNAEEPSAAWTKFDNLVVALKDAKGEAPRSALAELDHLVNDLDLSSSRSDKKKPEEYDAPLAFTKLTEAKSSFDGVKYGLLQPAKDKAVHAAMNQLSELGKTLEKCSNEAPDDKPVNVAKEKFHALESALSASTFASHEQALPTFARLKNELWAFGDPMIVEARNGGNNRIITSRIQPTTLNPTEHGFVKVFRAVDPEAMKQVLAASLTGKVWAAGSSVAYSIPELSASMKIHNPADPATMAATIEYTDEAKAAAAHMAKDAFSPRPEWARNFRDTPTKNGVSCSTAIARMVQAGAIRDLEQKSSIDESGKLKLACKAPSILDLADKATGLAALNPKHVSPRTFEHLLIVAENEEGNPLFEFVGKMENSAENVRFTETHPPTVPEYMDRPAASDAGQQPEQKKQRL